MSYNILWKLKVHHHVDKSSQFVPIMSHSSPVQSKPSHPTYFLNIHFNVASWDSSSTVTRLWTWRARFPAPTGTRDLPLLQTIQSDSGAHPASYAEGKKGSYLRAKWEAHVADPHFLLVQRLRITGAPTCLHGLYRDWLHHLLSLQFLYHLPICA